MPGNHLTCGSLGVWRVTAAAAHQANRSTSEEEVDLVMGALTHREALQAYYTYFGKTCTQAALP